MFSRGLVKKVKPLKLKIVCSVAHFPSQHALTQGRGLQVTSPFPFNTRPAPARSIGLVEWLILCKFVLNHMQIISTNKNKMSALTILLYFKNKFWSRHVTLVPLNYRRVESETNWLVHLNSHCFITNNLWGPPSGFCAVNKMLILLGLCLALNCVLSHCAQNTMAYP